MTLYGCDYPDNSRISGRIVWQPKCPDMQGWTVLWAVWHRMCLGMFGDFFLKRDIICQAWEGHRRREQLQSIFCRYGLSGVIRGGIMLPNLCRVFSGRHMKKCKIIWCKILQGRVYRYTNVTYFFPANRVFNKKRNITDFSPEFEVTFS